MITRDIEAALRARLTGEFLYGVIAPILEREGGVELDEVWTPISLPLVMDVVARSFHVCEYAGTFGAYRAVVAIGGLLGQEYGVLQAGTCFMATYFDDELRLLSLDFFRSWAGTS